MTQACIADIYTGVVSQVGVLATLPAPLLNQQVITNWTAQPTVGQIWNSAIPASFADPLPIQCMTQDQFVTALGPVASTLWALAAQNSSIVLWWIQGITADNIQRSIAQPAMAQLEFAGFIPAGTTAHVWGIS